MPSSSPEPELFRPDRPDVARTTRRRNLMMSLVLLLTSVSTLLMADIIWRTGVTGWKIVLLVLFVILSANIAFGFAQALVGFLLRIFGGDSCRISASVNFESDDIPLANTAIVMPIYNEDVSRVYEGLRVIFRSLEETGKLEPFDFFILSDSTDPNIWVEEESAWVALVKQLNARGRLFYRRRRVNINKKSGNLSDFCRRWGKGYRYMVVLDADSIMSGQAIVRLVQMMEKNPGVGIVQTVPRLVGGETLFQRLQQFGSRLYGPIFQAGLNFWWQGEGNYWGHNAIIRLAPFIQHCALPDLPGSEPFGGKILSHDYVEAALMRRGGWSVWLAYDIEGSFEEGPPNLIEFAKRDRRWSQGNLQHSWLLAARGLKPVNRLHLFLGIMAYVSSPVWLLFLIVSTIVVYGFSSTGLTLIPTSSFMDVLDIGVSQEALLLFVLTAVMLFLPKVLSLADLLRRPGEAAAFGGWIRVALSSFLEVLLSVFLAPVNMLFISKFVAFTILGKGVSWVAQQRGGEEGLDWREAILTHAGHTATGIVWGALGYYLSPAFFWWLLPVVAGMIGSIPLSIFLGQIGSGNKSRRAGLFLTPEETRPPDELVKLAGHLEACRHHIKPIPRLASNFGLVQAVLDPYVNAVHISLIREKGDAAEDRESPFGELRERLLRSGPEGLSAREKVSLLQDANSMIWLHRQLWARPADHLADWWKLAIRQYNTLTPVPQTALYR